jgi:tRNA (guanine-N7-)-methyltransferase
MINPPRSVYANKLSEFSEIAFANERAFTHRDSWREFFSSRIGTSFDGRVVLEIGCADGEFLARIASKYPTTAFIGIDWKCKAIYDAAARIARDELLNVALIRGRAQDICRAFGNNEVDEIWIFHPEPCERDVEIKNRLISESFLASASKVLRDDRSRICLKTDHVDYYEHVLATLKLSCVKSQLAIVVKSAELWNDSTALHHIAARAFGHERTAYESRFIRRRQPIHYVELAPLGK